MVVLAFSAILSPCKDITDLVMSEEVHVWTEFFSRSQISILGFARAVITNPEMMVVHMPTSSIDEITSEKMLFMLSDFTLRKGVLQNDELKSMRRPGT